jgi:hypothetical protein
MEAQAVVSLVIGSVVVLSAPALIWSKAGATLVQTVQGRMLRWQKGARR